jgi:Acetyltransferase (GNAT) domain
VTRGIHGNNSSRKGEGQLPLYEGQNCQYAVIELLPASEQIEATDRWQELEQRMSNTGLTNSWPWIKTWLDNYGDVVQTTFAFGNQDNWPIGAALITEATWSIRGIPIPAVHLGTAGEPVEERTSVEYNRLLVAPENLDAFAMGLIGTLQQRFRWSALRLNGFVPEHAEALIRACANAGLHFRVDERNFPVFDFQKAADEGFPENRWEAVGEPGALQSDRVRRYHEDLIDALSLWPQGSLIIFRVKQSETTIGCLFNFVEGGRVMFYKSGLPLFGDNRLKPGLVTHLLCMQECKRRGLLEEEKCRRSGLSEEACRKRGLLQYEF